MLQESHWKKVIYKEQNVHQIGFVAKNSPSRDQKNNFYSGKIPNQKHNRYVKQIYNAANHSKIFVHVLEIGNRIDAQRARKFRIVQ